jgi:hypothetical protein
LAVCGSVDLLHCWLRRPESRLVKTSWHSRIPTRAARRGYKSSKTDR